MKMPFRLETVAQLRFRQAHIHVERRVVDRFEFDYLHVRLLLLLFDQLEHLGSDTADRAGRRRLLALVDVTADLATPLLHDGTFLVGSTSPHASSTCEIPASS